MTWLVNTKDWGKHFVGFDRMFDHLEERRRDMEKNWNGYPPFSIKKPEENKYVIELAVAGFAKQDIEIKLDGDRLFIKGKSSNTDDSNYLFKGIANREFTRSFTIEDGVQINSATMVNGMLKVFLERLVPEEKKPKVIEISDEGDSVSLFAAANPQLLNEEDREVASGKLM